MSDLPDDTLPISIVAVTISSLPIDIVAQTVGNLAIDIAAQSLGNVAIDIAAQTVGSIDINIASSAATLNVDIIAQTAGDLTVNVTAGVLSSKDINTIANPSFESEAGWNLMGGAEISDEYSYSGQKSCKFPADEAGANIESVLISPPIPTDNLEALTIMIRTTDVGSELWFDLIYSDGTYETTILSPGAIGWKTHAIDYTAGKYIQSVWAGHETIVANRDVFLDDIMPAFKSEIRTNITSSIQLNMNLAASDITLDINIAAQDADVDVNIAASAVEIDIKTSGGANIIIDKLTQTAYKEARNLLTNYGASASWENTTGNGRDGKWFSRGCRGFLVSIAVYCHDAGSSGGTITVYVSPQIGMGYLKSATITVPAGGSATWREATFSEMWPFDALFIYVVGSTSDMEWGYDTGTPNDAYDSSDAGASWAFAERRRWFVAGMYGQTVGDVPVTGTLNVVIIPAEAGSGHADSVTVNDSTLTSILTVLGPGRIERIALMTSHDDVEIRLYIDGTIIDTSALLAAYSLKASNLNTLGLTSETPQIQLYQFVDEGICLYALDIPFEFLQTFEIKAYHEIGVWKAVSAGIIVNCM